MRTAFIVGTWAACHIACAAVPAAEHDLSSTEEIIVTAAPPGGILQPTTVLRGDELLLKTAPSLGETLANELGLSSSYFGPAASRPIIRGLGGSRVTMLTDSASTLDASDVSPDHAVTVEPLLADQIEIIRGPSTLLYGSAAAGGVVNVTDSRIPKQRAVRRLSGGLELRGSTAAEERAVIGRLDGGFRNVGWHLDGSARDTENLNIAGFATHDPAARGKEKKGELGNSYSESHAVAGGVSWVGDGGYLGTSISHLVQEYGLPGPAAGDEEHADEPARFEGPLLDMQQTRVDVRAEYRFNQKFWNLAKFSFGYNDYSHAEIEPSGDIATTFDNEAWQARFELVHHAMAGWHGSIGFQYDSRDFAAAGEEAFLAPTTSAGFGIFTVEKREFAWGEVHLGARLESIEHDSSRFENYRKVSLSTGAGATFNFTKATSLTFNVLRSLRNPAVEELYADGAHIATRQFERGLLVQAGRQASMEDAVNFDVAFKHAIGAARFDMNLYYYDIEDYVHQRHNGEMEDGLPVAEYAQGSAEFYGFETAATLTLPRIESIDSTVRVFSDFVTAELGNGDALPRIPPWRLGANVKLVGERSHLAIDTVYHGAQNAISSFKTNAYTMMDISYLYKLGGAAAGWEWFARATNLLDEDARKSTSFLAAFAPLPGRSLHLGLRARF